MDYLYALLNSELLVSQRPDTRSRPQLLSTESSGTTWSSSSSPPSGQRMSSTSQWGSSVTQSRCNHWLPPTQLPQHSLPENREVGGGRDKPHPLPGSNSFPVETLLTHSYVFNIQTSCCQFDVYDVAIIGCCCRCCWCIFCCCFFYTLQTNKQKEQVLFCKICATALEVFWGVWTICHISIMAAVFALCFVNIFLYYFCEILHLLLLYRQWRSVAVTCSGVCASVRGRACVLCWELEFCCELTMENFPALHSNPCPLNASVYVFFSKTCLKGTVVPFCLVHWWKILILIICAEPKNK